jgi:trehalose 6-phosphate synthase/phosphatase
VVILSGRDRESLAKWFGRLPAHLVAEHGYSLRTRKGRRWEELVSGVDRSWFVGVGDVMESYVARTPGSFIERKQSGVSWHFRKAETHLGLRHARELAHHLTEYFANRPLRVQQGACVVEAHGQEFDKGWAYRTLLRRLGSFDFILVAGDDRTDEDLFEAVAPGAWSIKIGTGPSAARHRLASPDHLRTLLASALARREKVLSRGTTPPTSTRSGQARKRDGLAPPGLPVGFTQDGLGDT